MKLRRSWSRPSLVVLEVVDGECRLRGQVADGTQRQQVIAAACRTPGVRSVQTHLHLPGEPPPDTADVLDLTAATAPA
jgi:hypothetical protein